MPRSGFAWAGAATARPTNATTSARRTRTSMRHGPDRPNHPAGPGDENWHRFGTVSAQPGTDPATTRGARCGEIGAVLARVPKRRPPPLHATGARRITALMDKLDGER